MKTIKNLTADQIRKSILQLAIQGKLVKQDPNDEPASELVKRIYEEKQRLIKEGKIKKDKNESYIYKGDDNCYYEKVGKNKVIKLGKLPFEIPENWSWIKLSSFCDIYTGDSINESDKNKLYRNCPKGYDYIGTKDVNFNHTIVYENGVKIPYDTQFKICPKSKILLCIEGGSAGKKIAFTSKDVCFGNKLACFNSWIIDDRYLYLFLQSPLFLQLFKNKLTGIISGVSINNLKQLFLPLPPLEEQERIVEKFKSCEPLLSRYELVEQNITLLETSLEEKLKASILQYAIEGKLVKQDPNDEPASVLLERIKAEKEKLISEGKIKRDKNDSIIVQSDDKNYYEKVLFDNIPCGWAVTRIGTISESYIGLTYKPCDISDCGTIVLRSSNIKNGKLNLDDIVRVNIQINQKLMVGVNDILICARNGSKKLVGKSALITRLDEPMTFGAFMAICKSKFSKYIFIFLQSSYFFTQLNKTSGTTTINQLTQKAFNSFLIPLPPFKEQQRISKKLKRLMYLTSL